MSGGEYKEGSIFLKETYTLENGEKKYAAEGGILAMAKRGGILIFPYARF